MSATTFRVEIANGQVKSLEAEALPLNGQGVLTLLPSPMAAPLRKAEIVEGPDGFLIFRGGGRITYEMVRELENEPW